MSEGTTEMNHDWSKPEQDMHEHPALAPKVADGMAQHGGAWRSPGRRHGEGRCASDERRPAIGAEPASTQA